MSHSVLLEKKTKRIHIAVAIHSVFMELSGCLDFPNFHFISPFVICQMFKQPTYRQTEAIFLIIKLLSCHN